jgi:3-dehydroquinate dehydratase II
MGLNPSFRSVLVTAWSTINGDGEETQRVPLRILMADGNRDSADSLALLLRLWGFEACGHIPALGTREPDVYGATSYAGLVEECTALGKELGFEVEVRETNDEAEMVRWLHEAADGSIPVVLNPAAFTHYSYAMRDAAAQRTAPLIEVHISNPHAREEFRHTSVVAAVASGTIAGFGIGSYRLALRALADELSG